MVKNKKYIILLFLFFINSCAVSPNLKKTLSINVITTNDIHGMLGDQDADFMNPNFPPRIIGAAGFEKYIKDLNLSSEDILIFDSGNFFQGHPLGIVDSGRTVIEWMNKIGYDALVPASYDFIFGYKNLVALSEKANFPFVACNLVYEDSKELLFEPYVVIDSNDKKIGVLGIVPSNLEDIVLGNNIDGIEVEWEIESLEKWVKELKEKEVDTIILLSSLGVPWDREEVYEDFIKAKNDIGYVGIVFNKLTEYDKVRGVPDDILENYKYRINSIIEKGPSYNSGIRDGDIFLTIDNTPIDKKITNRNSILDLLSGKVGSKVSIEVFRPETNKKISFNVIRSSIFDGIFPKEAISKIPKYINSYEKYEDVVSDFPKNSIELGYFSTGIDFIFSGGISKGYNTPWYDPHSHVYTFQNYGNLTGFSHFLINFDLERKNNINGDMLSGFSYVVENKISQTLFLDDFGYLDEDYKWIKDKISLSLDKTYEEVDWSESVVSDDSDIKYSENHLPTNDWDVPIFSNLGEHNIATWNCEFFPTNDELTIKALNEVINDMQLDVIAFQEIKERGWFYRLMQTLPDYSFVISKQSSFMDQAIIYKKDNYNLVKVTELFAESDYNYAGRPPLQCDLYSKKDNRKMSLINLHMKCCDSGLNRRKKAAKMLYDYLDEKISKNSDVGYIVLGDWNDDLKDAENEHCFNDFLNDDRYFFPTFDITYDISQASYPKEPYVSFLDHILVSKNLFGSDNNYSVQTIRLDRFMGGFKVYEDYISDHLPVLLSFD